MMDEVKIILPNSWGAPKTASKSITENAVKERLMASLKM